MRPSVLELLGVKVSMSQFLAQATGQTGRDIDVPFGTDIRPVDEHLLAILEF